MATKTSGGVPDIKAAKRVPIEEVVKALGLEVRGTMVRCWHPENHQHEDRTPSVGIWKKKNLLRCFGCQKTFSTIDVVMDVLGLTIFEALLWLDTHFGLPCIPKKKHLSYPAAARGRVGVNGRLERMVRSGFLTRLESADLRLLVALDAFADSDTVTISYAGLRRYAGIADDHTISRALKRLASMHAVDIIRGSGGRGVQQCSTYRLTMEDSRFLALLDDHLRRVREEIDVQREMRARRRSRLQASPRGQGGVGLGIL